MNIVIDRRFFTSGAALGSHAERVLSFVDKLLADEGRAGTGVERIDKSADAKFVSLRVDSDLRAIGLESGPELVLLYVGHHDEAYRWARTHRTMRDAHGLAVVGIPDAGGEGASASAGVPRPSGPIEPCSPAGTCDVIGH
jgi:hypothetical protein